MSENELREIFSINLKLYLRLNNNNYSQLANAVGVGKTSVFNWVRGVSLPRMDKIDSICKFLGISRSELLEKDMSKELKKNFIQSEPNKTTKELVKECEDVGITVDNIIDDYSKQGFSKEELESIRNYAEFIKAKRFSTKKYTEDR